MSDPDSIPQVSSSGSTNVSPRDFIVMPLDPSLYKLEEDEAAFFKQATGIPDDEELKQHILRVQAEAYEVRQLHRVCRQGTAADVVSSYRFIHTLASAVSASHRTLSPPRSCH